MIGETISYYYIVGKLGAGGMGEVWRARDTRLDREVAIKVLPASFANDEDRLRRFEQEARATSALNHPNILTIYDIGNHEGSPYIVSELLEGEELREQLNDGALTTRKAIDYAQQITQGLSAAHEKRITHRDLKPENIFITNDGRVKVLDFGLAKLKPLKLAAGAGSEVATQKVITDPGTIMGTVEYMSPEQVRGHEADHRSDIFSFGAILYEMLCGKRAFQGETMAETMTAILKQEPEELAETNAKINPALEKIVRRCLEKKPERRFQSTSDLSFALEALSTASGSRLERATVLPAVTESADMWRLLGNARLAWIVASVLLLALLAALPLIIAHLRHAPTDTHAVRVLIPTPDGTSFLSFAISPDGRRLAFIAIDSSGKRRLWVRPLDSLTAQPLAETDSPAVSPFWSADSRFIVFSADGKLKKIDAAGGPAQTLVAITGSSRGGSWSRDGVIIFAASPTDDGLYRVSAAGGEVTPVTTLDQAHESSHLWPQFLPDGRHFLYFSRQTEKGGIYVGSLDSKETKRILDTAFNAVYVPQGYLLFMRESALMAQPFDADKLELTGEAFQLAEPVAVRTLEQLSLFSVSEGGVLVYESGGEAVNSQLNWYDRTGKKISQVVPVGNYWSIWLSPDEKRVAVERLDKGTGDIWLIDIARNTPTKFTFDPAWDFAPVWSPDGSKIVFSSTRDGVPNLYVKPASGSGNEELLLKSSGSKTPADWSLDGEFILYSERNPKGKYDLWVLPLEGDKMPRPFGQDKFRKVGATFSPDGKWVAYSSDESGQVEVYVQPFPGPGAKHQVSTSGGFRPIWRRDGKELFYVTTDRKLMAVELNTDSTFGYSLPKPLFDTRIRGGLRAYAVSRDGQRFLINDLIESSGPSPITVVLNWTADLKR